MPTLYKKPELLPSLQKIAEELAEQWRLKVEQLNSYNTLKAEVRQLHAAYHALTGTRLAPKQTRGRVAIAQGENNGAPDSAPPQPALDSKMAILKHLEIHGPTPLNIIRRDVAKNADQASRTLAAQGLATTKKSGSGKFAKVELAITVKGRTHLANSLTDPQPS